MKRHRNDGLRRVCACPRRAWTKCSYPWHLKYKPRRGPLAGHPFRFSLDRELGKRVESKSDALTEAHALRAAIGAGTFRRSAHENGSPAAAATLEQLGALYFKQHVNLKTRAPLGPSEQYRWDLMMRTEIARTNGATVRLGAIAARDVSRHDIDAFIDVHRQRRTVAFPDKRGRSQTWHRGGLVAANRCLGRLRAFFGWAVDKEHVQQTPFRKAGQAVKGFFVHEAERERRLEPGEEDRLLAAANPHLRALITAALETGCRVGELLSLQWKRVRWDLNEIHFRAEDTKARRARLLPMSQRLRALLEMRRLDQDGRRIPPDAFVFGDETGARLRSVKTAWANAVLKAHGIEPKREKNGKLTTECQQQLAAINLNFHDLRREAGSRMLEGRMPLNIVQQFIDHPNISTTSRYLKVTRQGITPR